MEMLREVGSGRNVDSYHSHQTEAHFPKVESLPGSIVMTMPSCRLKEQESESKSRFVKDVRSKGELTEKFGRYAMIRADLHPSCR